MQKYFKKTLAGIFAVALVASAVPLAPFAPILDSISITASAGGLSWEEIGESDLQWAIENTTLKIQVKSGGTNTAMPDWEGDSSLPPWKSSTFTSVEIFEGVTNIGDRAFGDCKGLKSVTIPDSVTSIGFRAFYNTSLESVTIPASVTSIGNRAFLDCKGLKSVTIPEGVTSIGNSAFAECSSLTSITIPDSVTSIDYGAFCNTSLTSVTIPDSVKSIGNNAFSGCTSLTSVTISDSMTGIGDCVFMGCSSLTSITIPDFVTSIGWQAFADCDSLTSITIPASVTSIDEDAFYGCSSLENVHYTGSASDWDNISIASGNDLLKNAKITYGKAAQKILDSELTWEIDENGVLTITGDDEAFPECWVNDALVEWCDKKDDVTEVVFATPNLKKLGSAAFAEFPMTKITLPETLTEIGYAAFQYCDKLESLDIPTGVKEIPGGLVQMKQDESNNWASITSLKSISMASDVTKIGDWAFANCTSVTSFAGLSESLPGITSLGDAALMGINISEILIYIPSTLEQTRIGNFTFNGANLGTDLEIPSFITEIGQNGFAWANLVNVTIPATVTKIETSAFEGWGNLQTITLKGAADSVTIADDAFKGNNVDWNTMTFYVPASQVNAYKNMKALEGSNVIGQATATFDLGGKGDNFTLNTDDEVKITEPTAPTADGFVFAGWYTDNTYATEFNFNDALTDDEVTIYAKWDAIPAATGNSVSYDGDVTINFHYLVSESYKNGYVKFSDGTVVKVEDTVTDTNGNCVFPISMPAKNMYDEITAQFYDANDVAVGDAVTFDLVTYMDKVKAYDSNYSDFVDSFLEYGACAAEYFGVKNAPASSAEYDYDTILGELAAQHYDSVTMSEKYVGATMLLKSTPILRLYYKEEVNGLDLGDNAKWDTNEMNQDLTFIQKEISATDFATTFNGYSVYHYLYKALEAGDDDKLMKLCAALYEFSKAANAINT